MSIQTRLNAIRARRDDWLGRPEPDVELAVELIAQDLAWLLGVVDQQEVILAQRRDLSRMDPTNASDAT